MIVEQAGAVRISERVFGRIRVRLARLARGAVSVVVGAEGVVSVYGVRRGRAVVASNGDRVEVAAGGMAIVPSGWTATVTALHPSDVVCVTAPLTEAWVSQVHTVKASASLVSGTLAFAAEVVDARDLPGLGDRHVSRLLREMVGRLLIADAAQSTVPLPVQRAWAVIDRLYADPALSSRLIADEVNLSVRQLERLFQAQGTSIAREVRRARISAAEWLLAEDTSRRLSVDRIAQLVGFADRSSLARAMATEGSPTPSALRARA